MIPSTTIAEEARLAIWQRVSLEQARRSGLPGRWVDAALRVVVVRLPSVWEDFVRFSKRGAFPSLWAALILPLASPFFSCGCCNLHQQRQLGVTSNLVSKWTSKVHRIIMTKSILSVKDIVGCCSRASRHLHHPPRRYHAGQGKLTSHGTVSTPSTPPPLHLPPILAEETRKKRKSHPKVGGSGC